MVTPAQRHEVLAHLTGKGLSQRSACRWSGLSRHVARYRLRQVEQDVQALAAMHPVMRQNPRFGYRRVAVLAQLSFKRAWRLWKQQGFAVQPARVRRPRSGHRDERLQQATHRNHVWTYDILYERLADGRFFKTLSILDEFTRECLAIHVAPSIRARDVVALLQRTMQQHGRPQFLRSDNGSEFTALAVQQWLLEQQVGPSFITPGHPWQNGFIESFHGKFRDECLNREWFTTGYEATIVIEHWRKQYNTQRPHSALGYQTPAQVAALSTEQPGATLV
jgi:transposase InsO family protein